MKYIYIVLVTLLIFTSCGDQDYLHEKYLEEGEITYIGMTQGLLASPGEYRIELIWGLSKDPKALYTLVEIGDVTLTLNNAECKDTYSFLIENEDGDIEEIETIVGRYLIENLEEKDYTIKLTQTDGEGNTSVESETFTTTYGDKYQARLLNQSVLSMDYIDTNSSDGIDSMKIVFQSSDEAKGISLKYKPVTSSDTVTVDLPTGVNEIVLVGTAPGSEFIYGTRYLPNGGIDTINATVVSKIIAYRNISKTMWSTLTLADDTPDAFGWVVSNIWDGSTSGSGYHTPNITIYPVLLNIDLGTPTLVKGLAMTARNGYDTRLPYNFEIWMSNSANEVGVDGDDATWETKAVEAGWVKVDTVSGLASDTWKDIYGSDAYRYMRIRVLSVPGGEDTPVNIMEISLKGIVE